MGTTEHTINDAIAHALCPTRHGWNAHRVVRSENTGTLTGNNKRPDILVNCPARWSFRLTDPEQLGFALAGMEAAPPVVDRHAVRLELEAILATARAARDHAHWDLETHRRYRAQFPEKSKILPPEEAEFMRRQFVLELERIELLMAV